MQTSECCGALQIVGKFMSSCGDVGLSFNSHNCSLCCSKDDEYNFKLEIFEVRGGSTASLS